MFSGDQPPEQGRHSAEEELVLRDLSLTYIIEVVRVLNVFEKFLYFKLNRFIIPLKE